MINILKKAIKSTFLTYDYVIYFLWRLFNSNYSIENASYGYEPLISIIVPTYNTDHYFLETMIQSVIAQRYVNWELILIDDHSLDGGVRRIIKKYAEYDNRVRYKFLSKNQHISAATNAGIKIARGEYIGLLDHDDVIYPNTLAEFVKAINQNPNVKFIYSDEDKIVNKKRVQPFFKPSWNLTLLHCVNYITHLAVIKKETLDKIGYENGEYNGAQDWELFMRIGRNISSDEIVHIPIILYSWRMHPLSTSVNLGVKPYVMEAQLKAVRDDLKERGLIDITVERDDKYTGQLSVNHNHEVSGIKFRYLKLLLGLKRALFVVISSRMALSRHIYRTTSYDKLK